MDNSEQSLAAKSEAFLETEDTDSSESPGSSGDRFEAGAENEFLSSSASESTYSSSESTGPEECIGAVTAEASESEAGYSEDPEAEEDLNPLPLQAQLMSLLFVSARPLSIEQLAEASKSTAELVEETLHLLEADLVEDLYGITLQECGGSWQLRTGARSAKLVQRLIPAKARKLSRAAAETLAVVAYKQPVQRAEVEAIRGVDALPTLRTLLDAKLVRIVGREASPGQPALYGTTQTFLEKFGLRDLSELPTIREIAELSNDPGEAEADQPRASAEVDPRMGELVFAPAGE